MTNRITVKHLKAKVDTLNDVFGYPREAYQDKRGANGSFIANENTFTLDQSYGGYRLCQMCRGGGERDITLRGNARETFEAISAFIKGAVMMRNLMNKGI